MDSASKVEAAIKNFREKRKCSTDNVVKYVPCSTDAHLLKDSAPASTVVNHGMEKNNGVMEEFDQFILYHDLVKKKEDTIPDKVTEPSTSQKDCSDEVVSEPLTVELGDGTGSAGKTSAEIIPRVTDVFSSNTDMVLDIVEKIADGGLVEGDESEEDLISDDEDDYLFPTPDEIRTARPPEEGMIFDTLDEAV